MYGDQSSGGQDFLIREEAEGLKLDGDFVKDYQKKGEGNVPVSLPAYQTGSRFALVLIQHLHGHSCLVGVGVTTTPSLKDRSIGEVLPHLGPP